MHTPILSVISQSPAAYIGGRFHSPFMDAGRPNGNKTLLYIVFYIL
jgi:hypothetical protein